jgi:AAA+ ATPase superfamily predicted ATPase
MFIGRKKELSELEKLYKANAFQFVAVYGRRRVGKSALISHFTQTRRAIYFTAIESGGRRNLELFSKAVMKLRGFQGDAVFSSWEQAFDEIASLAGNKLRNRLILVIDEYPYLAQAERSISSILQFYCDRVFKNTTVMIILCGSSMSVMENQVLGYQSPLYGRRTAQMKIEPFDYQDAAAFVPQYSFEEKALVYGITGGVPKYLELFDDSMSLKKNILKNFLSPVGYLYEEPANLLKQELREPANYNLIIETAARGATRLHEIADKTGLASSAASIYINTLISLGIMKKETAITEENNKRKTLYRLADSMFIFWYRYIFRSGFSIIINDAEYLYDTEIEPDLNSYMGAVFETMCLDYLGKLNSITNKILPFKIRQIGRWWGANPHTKTEEEIDLVGINEKLSSVLFCECKYRNRLTDATVLDSLVAKAELWKEYKHKYFMLFSKEGFAEEVRSAAKRAGNVSLVTLEEMY